MFKYCSNESNTHPHDLTRDSGYNSGIHSLGGETETADSISNYCRIRVCVCYCVLLRCKPALLNHGSSNGGANNNQVVSLSSPTEAFSVPITLPLLFIQQLHISSSLH